MSGFIHTDYRDHLGNIRQVREANGGSDGRVIHTLDYYPFGAQLCDGTTDSNVQNHKYNGKEFDGMHGLNTYDYGARQYNPVTARWDRMDPLCEKYYSISPYAYCMNNPVRFVDPNGMWSWPWERKSLISYSGNGTFRLNMSKNKDVEKIGNNILSTLGRYDKEKNQYTYYISQ